MSEMIHPRSNEKVGMQLPGKISDDLNIAYKRRHLGSSGESEELVKACLLA
jgi:hypothetical protein